MHLVAYLESTVFGGAEAVLRSVLGGAVDEYRVTVVGPDPNVTAQVASIDPRIEVVLAPSVSGRYDARSGFALWRTLRSLRPDIVHVNLTDMAACMAATVVAGTLRAGLVLVEHSAHPPQDRLHRTVKRITSRRADAHVAVSQYLAGLVADAASVPLQDITVVLNGVNPVERPSRPAPAAGGVLRLGALTRLVEAKGIDLLLDAIRDLRDVELLVAGEGPALDDLVAQAAAYGLTDRVRFLGWLDDPDHLYEQVDVLVHPSRADVSSLSIMGAMHHGLPVVASAVGGIPELIDHGVHGFLFPVDDVAACRDAIEALRDPDRRARLGEAGYARARGAFTLDAQRRGYLDVYARAAASAAARRRRSPRRIVGTSR